MRICFYELFFAKLKIKHGTYPRDISVMGIMAVTGQTYCALQSLPVECHSCAGGSRGIPPVISNLGARISVDGQRHSPAALSSVQEGGCTQGPFYTI